MNLYASAKRNVGWIALAIGFVFLTAMILQIAAALLLPQQWFATAVSLQILNAITLYGCAMPLSLIFLSRCGEKRVPERRGLNAGTCVRLFCICMAGTYLCSMLGSYVNRIFSTMLRREAIDHVGEMTESLTWWQILIFIVILAPIFEELFFRKLVIDRLLPFGELPAILLSGLAFGLIHGNFNQFFYAAGVGILFGYVYLRSGNILYSIGMHMLLNLIGGLYTTEASRLLDGGSWGGIFAGISGERIGTLMIGLYLLFLLAAAIVSVTTILRGGRRYLLLWRPYDAPTAREWAGIVFRNPCVWFFFAITAIMFLL